MNYAAGSSFKQLTSFGKDWCGCLHGQHQRYSGQPLGNNSAHLGFDMTKSRTLPRSWRKPGPNSRPGTLTMIDARTSVARLMATVTNSLIADLGGDPSAAERLLVQNASVKAAKLQLLQEQLLDSKNSEKGEVDPKHVLAWSNSLRLDLVALGLKRRAREIIPGRAQSLAGTFDQPYRHAAE